MSRSILIAFAISLPIVHAARAQDYATVSFDDKGKLQEAKAWADLKKDITSRKPNHIFLVAHGWRTSKFAADETFTYFGKHLREQQGKDDVIEVIGIRWPSLIGENDAALDLAFKQVAKGLAGAIANSNNIDERKEKLKKYLKSSITRILVSSALKYQLPDGDDIDPLVDNFEEPQNVENILTMLSYYEMKRRAHIVGSNGVQACVTELQEAAPTARVHLIGHSFGCKLMLACLASAGRADRQVDSLTLMQGAVSTLCFAPKIAELKDAAGAYVDVPKRVKGPIAVTFTKNDKALSVAYVGASQAAGQVAELKERRFQFALSLYGALGARGVTGVADVPLTEMSDEALTYKLQRGFNGLNGDKVIESHGDIRTPHMTKLIWATARQ